MRESSSAPGDYIWHASQVHATKQDPSYSPVTPANNKILTDFAVSAVSAQPFDYVKTLVKDTLLSFGFPRISYPGPGTTYYYSFHFQYVGSDSATGKPISLIPSSSSSASAAGSQ